MRELASAHRGLAVALRTRRVAVLMVVGSSFSGVAPTAAQAGPGNPSSPCPAGAPLKTLAITAIDVKIPLSRFGDNDPKGKMDVLNQHIADVRAEEASQQVSIGLRDDPIQALVIRANEGGWVQVDFTNDASGGTYGVHLDGLAFQLTSAGDAVGNNPVSGAPRGGKARYTYWVPERSGPGGRTPPAPGARQSRRHPSRSVRGAGGGSTRLELSGAKGGQPGRHPPAPRPPLDSGWEAIIVPGNGRAACRENVQVHHEIGNESEDVHDKNGGTLPRVDPFPESYRPGARGMSYRSEPLLDRLSFAPEQESRAHGSYAFSDPATVTPHSSLGDPMKFRILHAGSEVFHVFHLHGGGIRWRLNPKADPTFNYAQTGLDTGLDKQPVICAASNRTDSQAFGPGESYNPEIEGGSGSVQQLAGEFLFHCHIVRHYVSGMGGFWRGFDTRQPDLAPSPDRPRDDLNGPIPVAVNSAGLLGKAFNGNPVLTTANLDQWIRPRIPPQDKRNGDEDSQIRDWSIDPSTGKPISVGEEDDPNTRDFPNMLNGVPGHPFSLITDRYLSGPSSNRAEILFDPTTGRVAWPLLRPHIGPRRRSRRTATPARRGVARAVGDFACSDRRLAYVEAGMWGLLRVLSDPACPIQPLDRLGCTGQPPLT